MTTRAKSDVICKICSQEVHCYTDDFKPLYNHYNYHHSPQKFKKREYFPKFEKNWPANVNSKNTLLKRNAKAKLIGATNSNVRRCAYTNPQTNQQCNNKIISTEKQNKLVRCRHHKVKSKSFAKEHCVVDCLVPYLIYKNSLIAKAGGGVFTTYFSFDPGDIITQFEGELMSGDQVCQKEHNIGYTLYCATLSKPFISGIKQIEVGKGFGSFINRRTIDHKKNVEFVFCAATDTVWVRATRYIAAGEELYTSYGLHYKRMNNSTADIMAELADDSEGSNSETDQE